MIMPNNHDGGDSFISDDEEELCPLCVEEMDLSDKNFKPCPCGYQVCQFCYNNIRQNPQLNGKCPACRRPYSDDTVEYRMVTQEEWKQDHMRQTRKEKERKQREREKKETEQSSKKHHLSGMRVIQKNLVYVIGLNPNIPTDELHNTLRGDQFFGQYGKIQKIVINRRNNANGNPGLGVYVTFARKEDAARCIAAVDGSMNDGKYLRAAYGTTKYCSSYLRGQPCPNPNCMFLHEPGEEADSYTRQDLSTIQHAARQGIKPHQKAAATPSKPASTTSNDDNHQNENNEGEGSSALPATVSWAAHRGSPPVSNNQKIVTPKTPTANLAPEPEPATPDKTIGLINKNLESLSKSSFTYAFSSAWLTEDDLKDTAKMPSFFTFSQSQAAEHAQGVSNLDHLLSLLTSQNCGLGSNNNTSLLTLPHEAAQDNAVVAPEPQQPLPQQQPQQQQAKTATPPPGLFSGHHHQQPSNPDRQVLLAQLMNGGRAAAANNLFQQDHDQQHDEKARVEDEDDEDEVGQALLEESLENLIGSGIPNEEAMAKGETRMNKEIMSGPSLLHPPPPIPPPPHIMPPYPYAQMGSGMPMPPPPPPPVPVPPPPPHMVHHGPPPGLGGDSRPTEEEQNLLSLIKGGQKEQPKSIDSPPGLSEMTQSSPTPIRPTPVVGKVARSTPSTPGSVATPVAGKATPIAATPTNATPITEQHTPTPVRQNATQQVTPVPVNSDQENEPKRQLSSKASVDHSLGKVLSKKEGEAEVNIKKLTKRQQKKLEQQQLRELSEDARKGGIPVLKGSLSRTHRESSQENGSVSSNSEKSSPVLAKSSPQPNKTEERIHEVHSVDLGDNNTPQEKTRTLDEERESKKKRVEEERKKKLEEVRERRRQAEDERKKKLEEERERKKQLEEEKKKRLEEERERKRKVEEEKRQKAEEEKKRKAEEEKKRKAEEEKKRKAEEEKNRKAEEEKKRKAEEEKKRKAEEEKKRKAEEEKKRKAEDEKLKAEEYEKRKKADDQMQYIIDYEARVPKAVEEQKEGKAAEEEKKKRKAVEEETKRKAAEEEKKFNATEEEKKRKAAEEDEEQSSFKARLEHVLRGGKEYRLVKEEGARLVKDFSEDLKTFVAQNREILSYKAPTPANLQPMIDSNYKFLKTVEKNVDQIKSLEDALKDVFNDSQEAKKLTEGRKKIEAEKKALEHEIQRQENFLKQADVDNMGSESTPETSEPGTPVNEVDFDHIMRQLNKELKFKSFFEPNLDDPAPAHLTKAREPLLEKPSKSVKLSAPALPRQLNGTTTELNNALNNTVTLDDAERLLAAAKSKSAQLASNVTDIWSDIEDMGKAKNWW